MSESKQGFKLLLTYSIKPAVSQSYFRFMLGRYVPLMAELGMEMSDAWHTAYGDQPDRLIGFIARDEEIMQSLVEGDAWAALNEELQRYVTGFTYKVVPYHEGFQF